MKNILEEAGFVGIQVANEIINILLFKFGERNTQFEKKYHVDNIYKKYCKQYDETKISKLYHFVYGHQCETVSNKFTEQYNIYIHTYLTIEHRYELAQLYILTYHTFNKKNFVENQSIQDSIVKYLSKYNKTLFTDKKIIQVMVDELAPVYTDVCLDGNCHTGECLIGLSNYILEHNPKNYVIFQNNIYGYIKDEDFYKLTIFNLLMHKVNIKNINKLNNEKVDIIIGKYDRTDMDISQKIDKLKNDGRCALVMPCSILYNNYVNKNSHSLSKTLSLTWEYKLRKLLVDQTNIYKIILFSQTEAVIFFVKGKKTQDIQYEGYDINISVNVQCIQDNDYCLLPYVYIDKPYTYTLKDIYYSKILACDINGEKCDVLNYRNILLRIYRLIGKKELIKKNTLVNIEYGNISIRGYRYIKELDMSLQGIDSRMALREITNQCKKNQIKLSLHIKLNDSRKVNIVI